ncbi:MAG: hypothetical protein H8E15_14125 [Planctomycetes bacterium]|nr:hypothetical protein [Planctomycetota bacterium]
MMKSFQLKLRVLLPVLLCGIAGAALPKFQASYDLDLLVNSPLTAGTVGNAIVMGSTPGAQVHLYNGSGVGSTTTAYGLLEVSDGVRLASRLAGVSGNATFRRHVPRSLAGLAVYLQAIDDNGLISPVHTEIIQ